MAAPDPRVWVFPGTIRRWIDGDTCEADLNEGFRQAAFRSVLDALTNNQYTFPVDVGIAALQPSHLVLTPLDPVCHQAGELGGQQSSTETALTEL